MKKILFTLFALVLASGIAAQIPEPDFIGEVLAIHSDGTAEKLEKHNVKMRTGAGVYIAGLAVNKSKTKILVAGSQANVRFAADEPVNLIVRAVDNKTDPMSIVRVFAMKNNRKQRSAVISAVGSFNVTSNDMEYLPFTAEKFIFPMLLCGNSAIIKEGKNERRDFYQDFTGTSCFFKRH